MYYLKMNELSSILLLTLLITLHHHDVTSFSAHSSSSMSYTGLHSSHSKLSSNFILPIIISHQLQKTLNKNYNTSLNNNNNDYNTEQENENNDQQNDNDFLLQESKDRFEKIQQQFLQNNDEHDFPTNFLPRNPFQQKVGLKQKIHVLNDDFSTSESSTNDNIWNGGKSSLYSDDELFNLLSIHNDIADELNSDDQDSNEMNTKDTSSSDQILSLHDLVMKTVGYIDITKNTGDKGNSEDISVTLPSNIMTTPTFDLNEETKRKIRQIKAIASDVDGTILTKKQTMHYKTKLAIKKAIQHANSYSSSSSSQIQYFFPATGKSRKGAIDSLSKASPSIGNLISRHCPGVYLQGLYCVDPNNNVIFEKKLTHKAIEAAEQLVEESNVSIVAYDGDDLYTTQQTNIVVHLHTHYGEPLPILLPPLLLDDDGMQDDNGDNNESNTKQKVRALSSHEPSMHKLLIMDDDIDKLSNIVRPKLEILASNYDACVTQALPTMLELLPRNCSKAIGVAKLCQALSIDVDNELLAIGDAENDAEMLKNACIGVAVGNASEIARNAADFVLVESNDEGGAGVAIETFTVMDQ